ncbi:unnamed protein product [Toxocara canis]|uniref:Transposase n=1 Tax=Toxocara canis TaxID=6265 RepID=A0A183VBD8_TOXCA|nr:unnamed protein product [Toxocara canis]
MLSVLGSEQQKGRLIAATAHCCAEAVFGEPNTVLERCLAGLRLPFNRVVSQFNLLDKRLCGIGKRVTQQGTAINSHTAIIRSDF